jgi:hypothetical protein
MTQVVDTLEHGTVITLESGGAIGIEDGAITVYKTGFHDDERGETTFSRDREWAVLTPGEARMLAGLLAERFFPRDDDDTS